MSDVKAVIGAQKAAPVKLNAKNMARLKMYSTVFDANVTMVVNRAVEEWLDNVGDVRVEALTYHDAKAVEEKKLSTVYTASAQVADELAGAPLVESN